MYILLNSFFCFFLRCHKWIFRIFCCCSIHIRLIFCLFLLFLFLISFSLVFSCFSFSLFFRLFLSFSGIGPGFCPLDSFSSCCIFFPLFLFVYFLCFSVGVLVCLLFSIRVFIDSSFCEILIFDDPENSTFLFLIIWCIFSSLVKYYSDSVNSWYCTICLGILTSYTAKSITNKIVVK